MIDAAVPSLDGTVNDDEPNETTTRDKKRTNKIAERSRTLKIR